MNYTEFMQKIMEETSKIGEDIEVEKTVSREINETYESLIIRRKDSDTGIVVPVEKIFREQREGVEKALADTVKMIRNKIRRDIRIDISGLTMWENAEKLIRPVLINRDTNMEMLNSVPHREILDNLCIIYKLFINDAVSAMVNEAIMNVWEKSEENLYEAAINNISPVIIPMYKRMQKELQKADIPTFIFNEMMEDLEVIKGGPIHVLSNDDGFYGAAAIACEEAKILLMGLAEKFQSDVLMIPSSVNEWLLIPEEDFRETDFSTMIPEINQMCLKNEEILSDHAYVFKWSTGEIVSK